MIRRKTILIVDDEPRIRTLLERQIKTAGYATLEAKDGDEALMILKNNQGIDIDLLILDIMLPQKSGLEIFETIKKDFPSLKVIVSSVYPTEDQKFLIWDADDYYYKADSISVLTDKLDTLLKV